MASTMARLGVPADDRKALNHTGGSFAGIVAVYQRHDFADEKRQALEVWAQHLLTFAEVERGPEPDRRPADVTWA